MDRDETVDGRWDRMWERIFRECVQDNLNMNGETDNTKRPETTPDKS